MADTDVPELASACSEEDDDDEAGWEEEEEPESPNSVRCLFCMEHFLSVAEALAHCTREHGFDLVALRARHKMNTYSFIKLINFVRSHGVTPAELMACKEPLWDLDIYLKPVVENDPWLMYDFEGEFSDDEDADHESTGGFHVVNSEDGKVTLTSAHFRELQATLATLRQCLATREEELSTLQDDVARMRALSHALLEAGISNTPTKEAGLDAVVKSINLEDDEAYFSSYAHFGIHHEMLSDKVRTESYRRALLENTAQITGKTVLDLGCGTGILAMFAAQAGAGKVVAVDQSEIIYHAMDIVRENKLDGTVELIKGRLEDLTNVPQVDVIVSEWMGYLLLFEGMLDSVVHARDHHLKPGGLILPNRCTLSLVGISDTERRQDLLGFWEDVYGLKMSCLRREAVHVPAVEVVPPEAVATSACQLTSLDLNTCSSRDVSFKSSFSLTALHKEGEKSLTALVGYFDVFFDLDNPVSFSTGPQATPTHWKQTIFFMDKPITLKPGQEVKGEFECLRQVKDARSLKVIMALEGYPKFHYIVS